jgi:hypothetical protein
LTRNPLWGAPRIHGELLKLLIEVGQTSVAIAQRRGGSSQGWRTLLFNHADRIALTDLFRRTDAFLPAAVWLPDFAAPSTSNRVARGDGKPDGRMDCSTSDGGLRLGGYITRDRDCGYGEAFVRQLRAMGIRDRPTAPRSPWQNAFAERLIGSIRREALDHVVVLGERHLRARAAVQHGIS